MNPFKSIWGLMLGILLLGVNRPIWAGSTSSVVPEVIKPKKADEGLRPVAGSRLVAVNRDLYINLYCKLGIRRDQPGIRISTGVGTL